MTVVTVYVYSPIASGTITGRTKYCVSGNSTCTGSGSTHYGCRGWADRVDVGGSGALYLRVNYPNARRVITYIGSQCCPSCGNIDVKRTVTADIYGLNNTGYCYIGSVMYGHVGSPTVSNGQIHDLTSGSLRIGSAPNTQCGDCYTGAHSHMERLYGSVVAPCCWGPATSTTRIYKFTWDNAQVCD